MAHKGALGGGAGAVGGYKIATKVHKRREKDSDDDVGPPGTASYLDKRFDAARGEWTDLPRMLSRRHGAAARVCSRCALLSARSRSAGRESR